VDWHGTARADGRDLAAVRGGPIRGSRADGLVAVDDPGRPARVGNAELTAAAARTGLTPTGYVGEAALAAARGPAADGQADTGAITRAELAQLQRDLFAARTALHQAAAGLRQAPAGAPVGELIAWCARSVTGLDAVVDRIHQQLRRPGAAAGDPQP
jgi:hypothetical protein